MQAVFVIPAQNDCHSGRGPSIKMHNRMPAQPSGLKNICLCMCREDADDMSFGKDGYDKHGYDRNGYDKDGYDK
jgi:hypothetical protein